MQFAQRLMSTRAGTIALSGLAAILAAGIFLVYLKRYRASVNAAAQPVQVLVAKGAIEAGTPGSVIGTEELFQPATTPKGELKEGAITDPADLRGLTATSDIYPGQQLTIMDFKATAANAPATKLTEFERGVSVPVDATRGMIGEIRAGDRVDVIAGFNKESSTMGAPIVRLLFQNVLVLATPEAAKAGGIAGGANNEQPVTLRLTDEQAARVAFARDNGELWLILRPKAGEKQHAPSLVTFQTMLLGMKPMRDRATETSR
jgi:Flp pilus assembly protein CpaB